MSDVIALSELIVRLESAEGGSMDLNEDIALATGYCSAWLSKHRYYNFSGPTVASFSWPSTGWADYDSSTGKCINLSETPPHGWGCNADLPDWSGNLDAALGLIPEGWVTDIRRFATGNAQAFMEFWENHQMTGTHSWTDTFKPHPPALALCIAALKATRHKEEKRYERG